jgi:hypothetical protein
MTPITHISMHIPVTSIIRLIIVSLDVLFLLRKTIDQNRACKTTVDVHSIRRRERILLFVKMTDIRGDEAAPLMFSSLRTPTKADYRTKFEKKLAVCSILASAGLERLAFYALAGNLTFFLTSNNIKWAFPNPIIASLIFLGKMHTMEKKEKNDIELNTLSSFFVYSDQQIKVQATFQQ